MYLPDANLQLKFRRLGECRSERDGRATSRSVLHSAAAGMASPSEDSTTQCLQQVFSSASQTTNILFSRLRLALTVSPLYEPPRCQQFQITTVFVRYFARGPPSLLRFPCTGCYGSVYAVEHSFENEPEFGNISYNIAAVCSGRCHTATRWS
jgi:hypothetical protein